MSKVISLDVIGIGKIARDQHLPARSTATVHDGC